MELRRVATALVALGLAIPVPASADNAERTGLTCGLAASPIDPLIGLYGGAFSAGPLVAGDLVDDSSAGGAHGAPATLTVHCWLQLNNSSNGGDESTFDPSCHAEGIGAGASACHVLFVARPADQVYLCTSFTMTHSGHNEQWLHDADPVSGGAQCELAVRLGGFAVSPEPVSRLS
jgi:hypothetical protein